MKILIVEDEHKIANTIKKGLEQEAYSVDVCYSGSDGLDLALDEPYDLIIMDRLLPGMDGLEITRELRKKNRHMPVLMLTAKSQIQDKVDGLETGADDYMSKPFAFEELLARIKALLRRPRQVISPFLTFGSIQLNPTTYEVIRKGKQIPLSKREFMLLEFFMRRPNRIMSKEQIIGSVWDYDSDILPNTVEAYVKHLRSKIDDPFPNEPMLIHTVRGFGYKFGDE